MTNEKEARLYAVGLLLQLTEHTEEPISNHPIGLVHVSPDGKNISPLVESIDSQIGQYHTDSDTVLIFYVRGGSVNVLDIDPVNATVRSDTSLSIKD